jgi:O-methyltransferase involved in polyketide biosynthesis
MAWAEPRSRARKPIVIASATAPSMRNRASAQDAYSQAADATRNFDQWLRNAIETQPYTSAIVALGIGWLLGRMHLPL